MCEGWAGQTRQGDGGNPLKRDRREPQKSELLFYSTEEKK